MDAPIDSARDAERRRVAAHIARGECGARARDTSTLPSLVRFARALLLDELRRYHVRGRFPQNRDFVDARTPYFIDAEGTRCAVAHLLEVSGEVALMERIARERNNALVPALGVYDRLLAWLDAVGLSVEEAALIQPTYGCVEASMCFCGGYPRINGQSRVPVDGVAEASRVRVIEQDGGGQSVVFRVDVVHGTSRFSEGQEFEALNAGDAQSALYATASSDNSDRPFDRVYFLSAEGSVDCVTSTSEVLHVSKADAMRALQSAQCRATLISIDPRFQTGNCAESIRPVDPALRNAPAQSGCACDVPGTRNAPDAPTTLGVLTALLGVLLARQMRPRRTP